jgi:hypothetical protein
MTAELPASWRTRAAELERFAPAAAEAFRDAAAELDAALQAESDEELTLSEAAKVSGYSDRRLRELIADGVVPNAGRKGAPRVRRADLPLRRGKLRPPERGTYDVQADAQRLMSMK